MIDLSVQQVVQLLRMVSSSQRDELDCDGCFELIAEFAEARAQHTILPIGLEKVQRHLEQCQCCKYEFDALMHGLAELREGPSTDSPDKV